MNGEKYNYVCVIMVIMYWSNLNSCIELFYDFFGYLYKLVFIYYLYYVLFWGWGMGMDFFWKV